MTMFDFKVDSCTVRHCRENALSHYRGDYGHLLWPTSSGPKHVLIPINP